jgi:hypothetical protein
MRPTFGRDGVTAETLPGDPASFLHAEEGGEMSWVAPILVHLGNPNTRHTHSHTVKCAACKSLGDQLTNTTQIERNVTLDQNTNEQNNNNEQQR